MSAKDYYIDAVSRKRSISISKATVGTLPGPWMSEDPWAQLIQEEFASPSTAEPEPPKPRRGRPPGQKGSRALRAHLAEQRQKKQEEELALLPLPGTAAFARLKKEEHRLAIFHPAKPERQNVPKFAEGFGPVQHLSQMGSMLQRACFATWLNLKQRPKETQDLVVKKLLDETALMCSSQALGGLAEPHRRTTPKTVQSLLLQTGAAIHQLGGWLWGALLHQCQTKTTADVPEFQAIMHLTALRYDETPHKLRVASTPHGHLLLPSMKFTNKDGDKDNLDWLRKLGIDKPLVEDATHAKIMQVEYFTGSLVKHTATGHFCWTFGEVPTALSAMDRTTGENLGVSI